MDGIVLTEKQKDYYDSIELSGEERNVIARICKLNNEIPEENLIHAMKSTPEHRRKWKLKGLKQILEELESDKRLT